MRARKEREKGARIFLAAAAATAAAAAAPSHVRNRERILYVCLTRGSRTKEKKRQAPRRRRFIP